MSVGRICIREVDFADPTESAWQAAERMHQRGVGALVVIDREQRPVGMVTDRDLMERCIAQNRDAHLVTVSEVMTAHPKTIVEDMPIETALAWMRNGKLRRLPVVDRDERLVGLVSLDDILMLLAEEFQLIGQLLAAETPRGIAETVTA